MVEKDEANFDTEISEDDVPGEWKLQGQVLTRSPVRHLRKKGGGGVNNCKHRLTVILDNFLFVCVCVF